MELIKDYQTNAKILVDKFTTAKKFAEMGFGVSTDFDGQREARREDLPLCAGAFQHSQGHPHREGVEDEEGD